MAYMFNSSRTTKIDKQKLNTFFLEKLAKREKILICILTVERRLRQFCVVGLGT